MDDPIGTAPFATARRLAEVADAVAIALVITIEDLSRAERVAFVLHDLFGLPLEEIAFRLDRSPESAARLARRARGRVRAGSPILAGIERPAPTRRSKVEDAARRRR